jgi:hypothetical protein
MGSLLQEDHRTTKPGRAQGESGALVDDNLVDDSLTPRLNNPNLRFMDRSVHEIPLDMREAVHGLVEANRLQCLWFMREDYFPESASEIDRVLAEIEARGDRQAWAKARTLRAWLSRTINGAS